MTKITTIAIALLCATPAVAIEPPTWRPVLQHDATVFRPVSDQRFAASPQFVPVADIDKAFPRKLSDGLDLTTVAEIIALIIAADSLPQKSARRAATDPAK